MINWVKERRELNDIFEVEKIIKEYYNEASYGLFFNRNNVGDKMINIYNKNGIQIDICYDYGYFEIFGLDSIQKTELTKFYENLKKGHSDRVNGIGTQGKLCKRVIQLSLDNIFIKEWYSIQEIQRVLNINHQNIVKVCQGKRKTAGGYKWEYFKEEI